MHRALEIAEKNIRNKFWWPVACIIAKNDVIVYEWANSMDKDSFDPTAHAEISTIRAFCKKEKIRNCEGYDIYITSEPCPMCLGAIYRACFDNIYFCNSIEDSTELKWSDSLIYNEFSKKNSQKSIWYHHINDPQWHELFDHRKKSLQWREDINKYILKVRSKYE